MSRLLLPKSRHCNADQRGNHLINFELQGSFPHAASKADSAEFVMLVFEGSRSLTTKVSCFSRLGARRHIRIDLIESTRRTLRITSVPWSRLTPELVLPCKGALQ
jgi:hypothetical protein